MLCLGIWINTLDMTLSVPAFRVEELQRELNTWLNKRFFTKRELQQLLENYLTFPLVFGQAGLS